MQTTETKDDKTMITYADLLYDAAGMMSAEAAHLDRQPDKPPKPWLDGAIRRLRNEAEMIHAKLSESTGDDVLSPEDISRITKAYDSTGTAWGDVHKLVRSNEALRQQLQAVESIALRMLKGWNPMFPIDGFADHFWQRADGEQEEMTPEQLGWFRRNKS